MTDIPPTAPHLGDLLRDSPSNWGKWGPDDEVGSLNYLGPEQVLAATRLEVALVLAFLWHGGPGPSPAATRPPRPPVPLKGRR